MIYKALAGIALIVTLYYALIGLVFMYGTKYDYDQSIKQCQEMVKIYPEEVIQ